MTMESPRDARIIFVPGLSHRLLFGGGMPRLEAAARRYRCSTLKPSFPALPSVVSASARSGSSPVEHGVVFSTDRAHDDRGWIEHLGATCATFESIHAMLLEHGLGSAEANDAARELDNRCEAWFQGDPRQQMVLICGGPGYHATQRQIDANVTAGLELEHQVARVRAPLQSSSLRRSLLMTAGIERILSQRACELWGTSADGDWLVLAEPHASFGAHAASCGHPDVPSVDRPVLIGWGAPERGWPADVHDYRIAPTVASWLGRSTDAYQDRPLPW